MSVSVESFPLPFNFGSAHCASAAIFALFEQLETFRIRTAQLLEKLSFCFAKSTERLNYDLEYLSIRVENSKL